MDTRTLHTPDTNTPFQTTEGVFEGFRPGGLPTPDWAFSINPTGPEESNALENDEEMNNWFEPQNIDVVMYEFSGGDPMEICEQIKAALIDNSEESVACWNGSLVACWRMPGGGHIIMAADNGGDCDVQHLLEEAAEDNAQMGRHLSRSHFSLNVFFDPESHHHREVQARELLGDLLLAKGEQPPRFGGAKLGL